MQQTFEVQKIKARVKRRAAIRKGFSYVLLAVGAIMMIAPFMWMVTTSLSDPSEVWREKEFWWQGWVPVQFMWKNYIEAAAAVPFWRFYFNSILVTVLTTLGVVTTSSLAGYAFSRLQFPGRDKIFLAYLATLMIPGAVTMIPVFILLRELGWVDTYKALVLPGVFTAYGTFMLRQFFMTLPRELEEAAKIDGCSLFGIYFRIFLRSG